MNAFKQYQIGIKFVCIFRICSGITVIFKMAATIRAVGRFFTAEQVQYILDLRFGRPANYAKPLRSFGMIQKLTGIVPATTYKICKPFLLEGRIVLGRAAIDLNAMLSPQERAFLFKLEELRNFSIQKCVALFAAMFGKKISTWNIRQFYSITKSSMESQPGCSTVPFKMSSS